VRRAGPTAPRENEHGQLARSLPGQTEARAWGIPGRPWSACASSPLASSNRAIIICPTAMTSAAVSYSRALNLDPPGSCPVCPQYRRPERVTRPTVRGFERRPLETSSRYQAGRAAPDLNTAPGRRPAATTTSPRAPRPTLGAGPCRGIVRAVFDLSTKLRSLVRAAHQFRRGRSGLTSTRGTDPPRDGRRGRRSRTSRPTTGTLPQRVPLIDARCTDSFS